MKNLGIALFLAGLALTGYGLYAAYQVLQQAEAHMGDYNFTPPSMSGSTWLLGMTAMAVGVAVILIGSRGGKKP
jgi:hypothetical protein